MSKTALGPKEKHAIESEKIAREILGKPDCLISLSSDQKNLVYQAILFHDKPEAVADAKGNIPLEVQVLVDLDHLWSFTKENFWQDTVRKQIPADEYWQNLKLDLDSYFVTDQGKTMAQALLKTRQIEVEEWKEQE